MAPRFKRYDRRKFFLINSDYASSLFNNLGRHFAVSLLLRVFFFCLYAAPIYDDRNRYGRASFPIRRSESLRYREDTRERVSNGFLFMRIHISIISSGASISIRPIRIVTSNMFMRCRKNVKPPHIVLE